mgnify:CR=1 FL=1
MPRNRRGSGVRNSQSFEEQIQGVRDFFGLDKRTLHLSSDVKRLAKTHPAEPAPIIIKSKFSMNNYML